MPTTAEPGTSTTNPFTGFEEPDVVIDDTPDGLVVTIRGVNVYNPTTGELHSGGTADIALYMLDTAYDEDEFFVRHIYFAGGAGAARLGAPGGRSVPGRGRTYR